ncbi:coiled-coil domain-containing protein 81 [Alligator mississippiensis]|uniref:Coiled-coil domain-containing protein 81 n=2 Tax=Alligator mississippiensis TaxID=8496 RepID=A0A151M3X8_ALLMI|nr:coiled-coil domain-containing protein 81 [Alligator mississippiensis]
MEEMKRGVLETPLAFFPTLRSLSVHEIRNVWVGVSNFVYRNLSMDKGANVPGLGIFSLARTKLDLGGNRFIAIQRPVFLLSEKLSRAYGLKQSKTYTPDEYPVVPLNITTLSLKTALKKKEIEDCIRETVLYFYRLMIHGQPVTFPLRGIGVLGIQNKIVTMTFCREFLQATDGSRNLASMLRKVPLLRTVAEDSITFQRATSPLSRGSGSRTPTTSSHVARPRKLPSLGYKEADKPAGLETIQAENEMANKEKQLTPRGEDHYHNADKKETLPKEHLRSQRSLAPAKAAMLVCSDSVEKTAEQNSGFKRSKTAKGQHPSEKEIIHDPTPKMASSPCKSQVTARKEPCSLCWEHLRKRFSEKGSTEKEEGRMVVQKFQDMNLLEAVLRDQMKIIQDRKHRKTLSACNVTVAHQKRKENEKPRKQHRFGIARERIPSPLPWLTEKDRWQQIMEKREKEMSLRLKKVFIAHLDQVRLAEEVAAQNAKYLRKIKEDQERYKTALDNQVKRELEWLPGPQVGQLNLILRKNAIANKKLLERRRWDQEFSARLKLAVNMGKQKAIALCQVQEHKEKVLRREARRKVVAPSTRSLRDQKEGKESGKAALDDQMKSEPEQLPISERDTSSLPYRRSAIYSPNLAEKKLQDEDYYEFPPLAAEEGKQVEIIGGQTEQQREKFPLLEIKKRIERARQTLDPVDSWENSSKFKKQRAFEKKLLERYISDEKLAEKRQQDQAMDSLKLAQYRRNQKIVLLAQLVQQRSSFFAQIPKNMPLWDADMYFVLEPWEDRKIHSPDVTKAVGKDVQATAGSLVFGQTQAALEETECLLGKPPQDMGDRAQ